MFSVRRWELDLVLRFLLRLIACFCAGALLGHFVVRFTGGPDAPTSRFTVFLVFTLSFHGAVLGLIHVCLREHGMRWSEAFGFRSPRVWHTVLLAAAATVLALPLAWLLARGSDELMQLFHWAREKQSPVELLQATSGLCPRIIFGVVAIGLAPLAEEVLFRGVLYALARQYGFPRLALWGSSALFALSHMNVMIFVPLLVFAVILAFLYENTRNLLAPILAHSLFNAVNFVCLIYDVQPLV